MDIILIMMSVRGVPSKAPHNSIRLRFRSAICGFFQQCFVYFITVVVIITVIDASFPPQEYSPPPQYLILYNMVCNANKQTSLYR